MVDINLDGLSRGEARAKIVEFSRNNRNEEFIVEELSDGRFIKINTDGRKTSLENGVKVKGQDFTIHYTGETSALNYFDDIIIDLIKKQLVAPEIIPILINALEDSANLVPYVEIIRKHPKLNEIESRQELPGHTIEFLLGIMKWMCIQEDVNYWGRKPNGKRYEGREKPLNFLKDYFIKGINFRKTVKAHFPRGI